jgi:tocopherol cyclase
MFKNARNPDLYHGFKKKKNFFEGWYFKITDKTGQYTFAFIPGIIKGFNELDNHAFIQVLDGIKKESHYLKYGVSSFKANKNEFDVSVDTNSFSLKELKLNHYGEDIQLLGNLKFVDIIKWPDTFINPGSMGFYNYLKFMECYSQVCCLDGKIIGKLLINNEEIDFTGGNIYIEKNWGKNFPISYIWVQSNHFKQSDIALTCSIGRVPLPLYSFSGFLTAFRYDGHIYKFTSVNRSKLEKEVYSDKIILSFVNKNIKLKIEFNIKEDEMLSIKGPNRGAMSLPVQESITSQVKVELIDLHKERLIFSGIGEASGVEIMGDLNLI